MNQLTVQKNYWPQRIVNTISIFTFAVILGSLIYLMLCTLSQQVNCKGTDLPIPQQITCWFDPVFTIYNLCLLLLLIAIVPSITFFYVRCMRTRKEDRLWKYIPKQGNEEKVNKCLDETFRMSHYAGSMTLLSIVILFGGMIILLLKPMPHFDPIFDGNLAVDFTKGANFLMLGSYMHYYIEGNIQDHMRVLIATLTAFQFGFLGAYTYFITHLVRSYFTLDLSPNIYIYCTVRIMLGAILSLVLSFFFISAPLSEDTGNENQPTIDSDSQNNAQAVAPSKSEHKINTAETGLVMSNTYYYLPLLSFFIGFFPLRGLLFLERTAGSIMYLLPEKNPSTKLTKLTGMSYQHEVRLKREGYDNVENFVDADILYLAIHTGFPYRQLNHWLSQAKLICCYGEADYARLKQATSIDSAEKLLTSKSWFESSTNDGVLKSIIDESLYQKTRIILNSLSQEIIDIEAVNRKVQ